MIVYLNRQRGQSTLEYAILVVVIIAALLAIQVYLKRGVQGRLKSSADDIGDQYSPGNTNVIVAERTHSHQFQGVGVNSDGAAAQGVSTTYMLEPEVTNSITKSVIVNDFKENWGGS